jgi:DNA helicase IV
VLDILARDVTDDPDPEILTGYDMIDATRLADRNYDETFLTAAERAAIDRTWAFGHVIVDEAQELSEMAWRMLMRRCPARSMTLVGDVAQTGDLAGTSSWQRVLGPHVQDRWRLERLSINYRAPAEIMAVAADVLAGIDPSLEPPRSVRESGVQPWREEVPETDLPGRLADLVAGEAASMSDGRLAVIVPATRLEELGQAIREQVPDAAVGEEPELASQVVVLSVAQAKGLEFDSVFVADPHRILADSPRGAGDLYVALTRATQRLGVVHSGEPPSVLSRMRPRIADSRHEPAHNG